MIPTNLAGLYVQEEELREKALELIAADHRLRLHMAVVETAMEVADTLRQFSTNDEDIKVTQMLGMRTFNAFGASLKLTLSGYQQNGALIMRDILETVFLLDLFRTNRSLIARWRLADKKARLKEFGPVKVREALDTRDGLTTMKRFEMYETFSELAGHPNMKSALMMRPRKDGDAVIGPFIEAGAFNAVVSEMGRLAIQAGEILEIFFPQDWGREARLAFGKNKSAWLAEFYGVGT